MQIAQNRVVAIHYTLTNNNGEVIDASPEGEPLSYLHGTGGIIPGLEKALEGKEAGAKLDVTIPPEDAYGERSDSLTQVVPRTAFESAEDIEVGMQFRSENEEGQPMIITIAGVEGDEVTIDGNHPLAGETLNFAVEIAEIRDATAEELEHGHAHGDHGGHEEHA